MLPSDHQPTERFSGLAGLYSQYRPVYPAAALDFVLRRCGLTDSIRSGRRWLWYRDFIAALGLKRRPGHRH
jgi:hypothetical protein